MEIKSDPLTLKCKRCKVQTLTNRFFVTYKTMVCYACLREIVDEWAIRDKETDQDFYNKEVK